MEKVRNGSGANSDVRNDAFQRTKQNASRPTSGLTVQTSTGRGACLHAWLACWILCAGCASLSDDGFDDPPAGKGILGGLDRDSVLGQVNARVGRTKEQALKSVGLGPDERIARKAFAEGDALFRQKEYRAAEKKYRRAAKRWPDSALEEDAMFMQGESQFFADRYSKANDTYGELVKKYTNSRHLDTISKRWFSIARFWEDYHREHPNGTLAPNVLDKKRPLFDTGGHAIATYQQILENDSTGLLADDAVMQTANAYFLANRYHDASDYYKILRQQYPKSEHQYAAHLLGMRCELMRYQGPDYDATPLLEAESLVEQLLVQFPDVLSQDPAERERLVKTRGQIVLERARRDWEIAQYYDRANHLAAAQRYYLSIAENFPETPLAAEARTRLAQIGGSPENEPSFAEKTQTWLAQWGADDTGGSSEESSPLNPAAQVQLATQPGTALPPRF